MPPLTVLNNQRSYRPGGQSAAAQGASAPLPLAPRASDADRAVLERALRDLLAGTESQVRFDLHNRLLYATDASLYQQEPLGVVIPASTEDASLVLEWCGRNGVAVLPRGGGTSLAGQCTNRAVVVDLSRCRAVGPVQRVELTSEQASEPEPGAWQGHFVEVEPGCTVDELNEELARRGEKLFFAPDPATTRQAAIGGCVGNNAAGSRSIRYGRTSENILAIEAVLSTGERMWFGPTKRAGGAAPQAAARHARESEISREVARVVRAVEPLIRERFPKTVRRNAGYGLDMILAQLDRGIDANELDLAPLLCGSEGTLALTTKARVKLMPTPAAKGLLVASFATLEDAIGAVQPLLNLGLPLGLSAVELLDDVVLDAARGNIQYRSYVDMLPGANAERHEPKAVLYVEFFAFEASAHSLPLGGMSTRKGDRTAGSHSLPPGEMSTRSVDREGASSSVGSPADQLTHAFAQTQVLLSSLPGLLPGGIATFTNAQAMLKAWALRKAGEPLLHGLPGARKPITFVEDNAVPVERLGEFVREFKKIVARHGTRAAYWAHASVGVLHVRPMIDLHDPADRQRMVAIATEVADLARACGGIMSGEHGDGKVRGPLLERFFGPELIDAFRAVKRSFDPAGILNPGNIVGPYGPVESIARGLRVDAMSDVSQAPSQREGVGGWVDPSHGHDARPPASHFSSPASLPPTYFDYSDQHGFAHAVETCNGAGVCRKRSGGTMCPSYMATQDERHSTRGRGNALRLAISGQFSRQIDADGRAGVPDFNDAATLETLNLCLSCKACKSECPSNVDIARLKAEYHAQRYDQTGGPSFVARVFGHVRTLNRLGSLVPGLANAMNRTRLTKALARRVLNIDERRSLPRFERSLWSQLRSAGLLNSPSHQTGVAGTGALATNSPTAPLTASSLPLGEMSPLGGDREGASPNSATSLAHPPTPSPTVILYADCFTAYNEPRIGVAAARVLRAFGYHVRVVPSEGTLFDGEWGGSGCCGRAMISMGLLKDARKTIDSTLTMLTDAIDDPSVVAIVACEPSCLSAIKDDWLQLHLDTPLAVRERLARQSFLVEDFLERRWDAHPVRPMLRASDERTSVLLHGHCHQKALWGADTSAAILRRVLGERVKTLDTGCCGMAGSFGFTADRFELSQRIGELTLFPKVRAAYAKDSPAAAVVCAPGTSCRHQLHDAELAHALHPIELLAAMLSHDAST